MIPAFTPTRQLPASELTKRNIAIPFFHPSERDHLQVNYHLQLLILPMDIIDKLAIHARKDAAIKMPNPLDNRLPDSLDYPANGKDRHAFVRHMLFNRTSNNMGQGRGYQNGYDNILFKIGKAGIDVANRQLLFKRHAFALIATYYPALALEGEYALWLHLKKADLTPTSKGTPQ